MKNNLAPLLIIPLFLVLLIVLMSNKEINQGPQNEVPEQASTQLTEAVEGAPTEISKNMESDTSPSLNPSNNETEVSEVENSDDSEMEKNMSYKVTLQTTEGDIVIELNKDQTPKTVANFVKLSKEGFYDGVIFHRALEGFMIQGGDPTGTGTGGPGYKFEDEPFVGEYDRGTVAMANSGPNTNGSQFFIMHQDYPLPKNYTIFGKVISGMEAVDAIATAEKTMSSNGEMSKPVNPASITKAIVEEIAE